MIKEWCPLKFRGTKSVSREKQNPIVNWGYNRTGEQNSDNAQHLVSR